MLERKTSFEELAITVSNFTLHVCMHVCIYYVRIYVCMCVCMYVAMCVQLNNIESRLTVVSHTDR